MRPKARGLVQRGGPPCWLEEIEWSSRVRFCMWRTVHAACTDGPHNFSRSGAEEDSWMYIKQHHELRHSRNAWPSIACLVSGGAFAAETAEVGRGTGTQNKTTAKEEETYSSTIFLTWFAASIFKFVHTNVTSYIAIFYVLSGNSAGSVGRIGYGNMARHLFSEFVIGLHEKFRQNL